MRRGAIPPQPSRNAGGALGKPGYGILWVPYVKFYPLERFPLGQKQAG